MSRKKILVIEDDPALRQTIKDVLEIENFEVLVASDGQQGIVQLKAHATDLCVILLDLMMPVLNGWDFLDFQRNHAEYRHIPVVICSAYEASAKSVKPAAIVEKPVKLEKLLAAVRAFCS